MKRSEKREKKGFPMLSVWALLVRSSFYKILAVLFLAGGAEFALFYCRLTQSGSGVLFETVLEESRVHLFFLGALGAVYLLLILTENLLDSAGRYTMMRLRVTRTVWFSVKTVYNILCLLLLFVLQIWLVLGMAWLYGRQGEPGSQPQLLFLAFYRNEFLHCLLPLAETGKWVRNVLLLVAFGMEAAGGGSERRRQVTQALLFVFAAVCFVVPIGLYWQEVLSEIVCIVIIAVNLREAGRFGRKQEQA